MIKNNFIEKTYPIDELISKLPKENPSQSSLNLVFGDCTIRVSSNSTKLIDNLTAYYEGFTTEDGSSDIEITAIEGVPFDTGLSFTIKEPDPGKNKIKEEYVNFPNHRMVRKRLTDMLFIFGGKDNLAYGPCIKNDNQVINFINNRYIQWKLHENCLLGHAAAVEWKGRGLAIAGFSGMGKSSLSLHLMNQGLTFVSNDRLMITTNGDKLDMFGVPKLPRVNPGTVLNNPKLSSVIPDHEKHKFTKLSSDKLWDLEYKYDVIINDCFGKNKFVLSAPMDALVILNWKRKNIPTIVQQVDIQDRQDLLPAFIKSPGLFFEASLSETDFSEKAYLDHLKKCTVLEIKGGVNFEVAAEKCFAFLDKGSIA